MVSRVLAVFLALLALAIARAAGAADLGIVLSDTGGAYAEFAAAFKQLSEGSNWRVRWTGGPEALEAAPRTDVLIAVGSEATRAALRRSGGTPVLATLLPRPAFERALADTGANRPKGNVSAIYLDQPISRLLAFTRHLLPDRHRVGVLAGPETRTLLPQLRQAVTTAGLSLEVEEVDANVSPVPAENQLLPRTDVLLAIPDSSVYRRDNIRALLLTSYRFQRPMIGFSQSLVTAGALAAIYSTPTQIARQAMDIVKAQHPDSINLPPPQPPALFAITINHSVAQALGLMLPDEAIIRRTMAADKDVK